MTNFEKSYSGNDDGDHGECLIYRNKLTCVYLHAAIYILSNESWKNNNLDEFRKIFIDKNKFHKGIYDIEQENNTLIKLIIEHIKNNNKQTINNNIKLTHNNSYINFRICNNYFDENVDEEDECVFINNYSFSEHNY